MTSWCTTGSTKAGMTAKIRRASRLNFVSCVPISLICLIAFAYCYIQQDATFGSHVSFAGIRFIVNLLSPLPAPQNASDEKPQIDSTGYAVQTPPLTTPWTDRVGTHPWPEYPRPQLQRSEWLSLNGIWTYQNVSSLDAVDSPPFGQTLPNPVLIPSCLESGLSGQSKPTFEENQFMKFHRCPRNSYVLFLVLDLVHYPFIMVWPTHSSQFRSCGLRSNCLYQWSKGWLQSRRIP
jgi:hypothetical protein